MTTYTLTRGSEWSEASLRSDWGDGATEQDVDRLAAMVQQRFATRFPTLNWVPALSEVQAEVGEPLPPELIDEHGEDDQFDYQRLDAALREIQEEVFAEWGDGDA